MRLILPLAMLGALIGIALSQPDPPAPGPTPEQAAIAELRTELASVRASIPKIEPVKLPPPAPFEVVYPETQQTIEGLNTAVNRCVETCTDTNNKIAKLTSDVAKLSDAPKSCPVEVTPEKPKYTIELPTSEYNVAVQAAQSTNRKVMFVISQNNCVFCDQLEASVIDQPQFQAEVADRYVISKINISRDLASASHFTVKRTPAVLIYDPAKRTWQAMNPIPRNMPAFLAMLKGM